MRCCGEGTISLLLRRATIKLNDDLANDKLISRCARCICARWLCSRGRCGRRANAAPPVKHTYKTGAQRGALGRAGAASADEVLDPRLITEVA